MGKQSKLTNSEQLRRFREEQRKIEMEKRKKQNRLILIIAAACLLVAAITVTVVLVLNMTQNTPESNYTPPSDTPTNAETAVKMNDLDFSEVNISAMQETEEVTKYVKLTVQYTDENGFDREGDILIRLFDEVAPKTVENFQKLVKEGAYTNSTFHRIMKNFMIQGGIAAGATSITGEFTSNGFQNNLLHKRGVVSMARSAKADSATSQFFIMHGDRDTLDGNYASFGYVVSGMDVVDAIANTEVQVNGDGEMADPVNDVTILSAVFMKY